MVEKSLPKGRKNMVENGVWGGCLEKTQIFSEICWLENPQRGNVLAKR